MSARHLGEPILFLAKYQPGYLVAEHRREALSPTPDHPPRSPSSVLKLARLNCYSCSFVRSFRSFNNPSAQRDQKLRSEFIEGVSVVGGSRWRLPGLVSGSPPCVAETSSKPRTLYVCIDPSRKSYITSYASTVTVKNYDKLATISYVSPQLFFS